MSELARATQGLEIKNLDDLARLAKMFAESGFFKDTRDAAQCGVKILAGREFGFGPFESMAGIHIISGRPALGANLMAAAVKRSGRYRYRVTEMNDEVVSIEFFEDGESCGVSTFTLADAKKAGTQNVQKFPRNMLFARAMSNGVRWFCPDVFNTAVYTPEELGAAVDDEGDVIDVESAPSQPQTAEASPTEPDLPAPKPAATLSKEKAADLHKIFGLAGVKDHLAWAGEVVGRKLESFTELTTQEATQVYTDLKAKTEQGEAA